MAAEPNHQSALESVGLGFPCLHSFLACEFHLQEVGSAEVLAVVRLREVLAAQAVSSALRLLLV